MSICWIGVSYTLSAKRKIIYVFTIWLLISIFLLCIRYYYSLTLSSVSSFLIGSILTTSNVVLFFCCLKDRGTIDFSKFGYADFLILPVLFFMSNCNGRRNSIVNIVSGIRCDGNRRKFLKTLMWRHRLHMNVCVHIQLRWCVS